jgi:energy-coupling factor transporter ATP-binding protein EcfA2
MLQRALHNNRGAAFGYTAGKPTVSGADLKLEKGMRIAVLGPNGAGAHTHTLSYLDTAWNCMLLLLCVHRAEQTSAVLVCCATAICSSVLYELSVA